MDLDTFIVSVFCLIDERLKGERLRARGPRPKLSDAEILTIEVVGEFLGIDTETRVSTSSSDATTGSGFLPWARSHHLLAPSSQPLGHKGEALAMAFARGA
jgi:hypothetical protein